MRFVVYAPVLFGILIVASNAVAENKPTPITLDDLAKENEALKKSVQDLQNNAKVVARYLPATFLLPPNLSLDDANRLCLYKKFQAVIGLISNNRASAVTCGFYAPQNAVAPAP